MNVTTPGPPLGLHRIRLVVILLAGVIGLALVGGLLTLARIYGGLPNAAGGVAAPIYSQQGMSFSYPSGWHVNEVDLALHYQTVLSYLASPGASGTMTCGADYIPGAGGTCSQHLTLDPDSVVIQVSLSEGPPTPSGTVAWMLSGDAAATAVTVGGQPAARQAAAPDVADAATEWTIARPGDSYGAYTIVAYVKGPDLSAEEGQVQALIDSIAIRP